jgi:hypothetical protein
MPSIDTATEPLETPAAARRPGRARVGDPPRDFALRELAWAAFRALGGSDVAEKIGIITRGYGGRLSETLGFLPGRGDHSPAMIAAAAWSRSASRTTPMSAFGMAVEPDEPGKLDRALEIFNGLPALRRRRMLSVFGAATWPPRRKS